MSESKSDTENRNLGVVMKEMGQRAMEADAKVKKTNYARFFFFFIFP